MIWKTIRNRQRDRNGTKQVKRRTRGPERLEARRLLAADPIHVGVVYLETDYLETGHDVGSDSRADHFILSFTGGAPDTELSEVRIRTDKNGDGISVGDAIFDTVQGGRGKNGAHGLQFVGVKTVDGRQIEATAEVDDGGQELVLRLSNFLAGDRLEFTVDVDEVLRNAVDLAVFNGRLDVITLGQEFQDSILEATFNAPHYETSHADAVFLNDYGDPASSHELNLPADESNNADSRSSRSAAAVASTTQTPKPVAGVQVQLVPINTLAPQSVLTVTSAGNGSYSFTGLAPGSYEVIEVDQPSYQNVWIDRVRSVNERTAGLQEKSAYRIGDITLASAEDTSDGGSDHDSDCSSDGGNDHGSDGGNDHDSDGGSDHDSDCSSDGGNDHGSDGGNDGDSEGDSDGGSDGDSNQVSDGGSDQGSDGGSDCGTDGDEDEQPPVEVPPEIEVPPETVEPEPSSISGIVFVDGNGDCLQDADEPPLEGVTIELRTGSGGFITSTMTDSSGRYTFGNLAPGSYQVFEQQPADFLHGGQKPGAGGGVVLGEDMLGVTVLAGQQLVDYNFCEQEPASTVEPLPASLFGRVHVDTDGDCELDDDELTLDGVVVRLLDTSGAEVDSTTTNVDGKYSFVNIPPGTYTIVEEQPPEWLEGVAKVGSAGGDVIDASRISNITLTPGGTAVNYDFCERPPVVVPPEIEVPPETVEPEPSSISGIVFVDGNGDCLQDADEPPLEGVTIELRTGSGGFITSTMTDSSGRYTFGNLAPGSYQVFEQQPADFMHGGQKPGAGGGMVLSDDMLGVTLLAGQQLVDYNFCEHDPPSVSEPVPPSISVPEPSSISGRVWQESNPNQQYEPGDTPIPGVLVQLIDDAGDVIAQTTTDAAGSYTFTSLAPGVYSVRESQPADFFHGGQVVGDAGGQVGDDDLLVGITLLGGTQANNYDFPEVPPAMISGFVFQDGDAIRLPEDLDPRQLRTYRDGLLTDDDTRLESVTLELRNVLGLPFDSSRALPGVYDDGPIRVITDANGYYEFTGLRPGTYHVYQVQPGEYIDGLDTPGTTGGVAVNPADAPDQDDQIMIQTLAFSELTDPHDDAILNITLVGGGASVNNNFSEIVIAELPPPQIVTAVLPLPQIEVPREETLRVSAPPIETFDPRIRLVAFAQPPSIRSIAPVYDEWAVSWHLSVINGGFPRGTLSDDGVIRGVSVKDTRQNWNDGDHNRGRWTIMNRDGTPLETSDEITLGEENATALAGDFDGDGTDEAVIYVAGQWFVDLNGNGRWDAGDLWIRLGTQLDRPVVGDWDGDGKDDIGIFGRQWGRDSQRIVRDPGLPDPANKRRREVDSRPLAASRDDRGEDQARLLRRGNDGSLRADAVDHVFKYGEQVDTPIAGDWNGDGIDQIAVFRSGKWLLDVDGDGRWTELDDHADFGRSGDEPIVGDFNGDEIDEIGIVRGDVWIIDTDGDRRITGNDLRIVVPRQSADSQPVVGDFDGDGKDEPGYYDEAA